MNTENFDPQKETIQDGELVEKRELDPSSREVVGIVAEDVERLEADGQYELEGLSEGLPENDTKVTSTREHLANIAGRAKELTKWAAAALAFSAAQPAEAQEIPQQEETEIVVTASTKPYKLEQNNPQREGYTTPEGYRVYLDTAWETLRKPYALPEFSLETVADSAYGKKLEDLSPEERAGAELRYESQKPRWDKEIENRKELLNDFEETIKPTFEAARNLSNPEIQKQSSEYQEAIQNLDDQREWLSGVVHSPEYRRRLKVNEKIDQVEMGEEDDNYEEYEGMPKDPLERRKYRVTRDVLRVSDVQHPIEDENNLGEWHPEEEWSDNPNLPGRAVIDKDEAMHPKSTVGVHELEHHVTEGSKGISPAAKWLYGRAFNSELVSKEYPDHLEYFSRPHEMAALKREFEYDLERLTDWRYGEPFTPKLLEQIQKLRDEGKFNNGSEIFLDIIKPGYLMRIMNTLAENETVTGKDDEGRVEKA